MAVLPSERSGDIRTSCPYIQAAFLFLLSGNSPHTHSGRHFQQAADTFEPSASHKLPPSPCILFVLFPCRLFARRGKPVPLFRGNAVGYRQIPFTPFSLPPLSCPSSDLPEDTVGGAPPLTARIFMAQHNDFGPPGHGLGFNQEKSTPRGVLFSSAGKYISPGKPYGYSPGRLPSPFSQAKPRGRATSWKPPARWKT